MQPIHTLIIQRSSPQESFTLLTLLNNGTTTPLYHAQPSSAKPQLTIFRLLPPPSGSQPFNSYQPGVTSSVSPYMTPYNYPSAPSPGSQPFHFQQSGVTSSVSPYVTPYNYPSAPPPPIPYIPPPYSYSPQPVESRVSVGTVSLSSISSKITLSIHHLPEVQMKRPDIFASGHRFSHPQLGTLEWKEDDLFSKRFKLVDQNRTVLARFDKWKPENRTILSRAKEGYAILIYIQADTQLLDWIVVSGLGAVEYRIHSDQGWDEMMEQADNLNGMLN